MLSLPLQNFFNCELAFVNFEGLTLAKEVKELRIGIGESKYLCNLRKEETRIY
jgi:hypothetical protein